ncbi:nucleoside hydrolase [Amycolatopsis sp. NPDC059027]|uniref:nucleoside hydrolase n=1 Tax=unclassified Amycolatopsis TaxID=2618356 RepID=UPI00366D4A41
MIFPRLTRVALAAALACAVSSAVPATAAESAAHGAVPVVFDGDMDFDDAATLAYLCQAEKQHRIDLRAVTVTNNGSGTPGRALTHVRTELERCGLSGIPVADGSPTGVNPQPLEGRAWTERVLTAAFGDGDRPDRPSVLPAWQLLAGSVLTAPRPVVVLATGPLTNVAKALDVPGVAARISRLSVMGGAFGVPGNIYGPDAAKFDGSQEVNMWLDPASAARVFAKLPGRVDIAPLDATNDVPVTQSFVDKIGTGRTPEARLVHAILTQPEAAAGIAAGTLYWWDTLAASVVFDRVNPVSQREERVAVRQDGTAAGRTVITPDGTPQRVGYHADRAQYEDGYFAMLTGG